MVTPWEQKGMVMRTMVERLGDRDVVLVDGVKVPEDDGWALVLPDPEEPVTHVWAEAPERSRGPEPGPSSTPSASARCCSERPGPLASGPDRAFPVGSPPMHVPDDLRYSTDHEWARPEGRGSGSGITDYAQDALGDVVFVDLPAVGAGRRRGHLGEVESTKSVSEIYAPVAGTVVAVNTALADAPELLNTDPYGAGWICEIEVAGPTRGDGPARRGRLPRSSSSPDR